MESIQSEEIFQEAHEHHYGIRQEELFRRRQHLRLPFY